MHVNMMEQFLLRFLHIFIISDFIIGPIVLHLHKTKTTDTTDKSIFQNKVSYLTKKLYKHFMHLVPSLVNKYQILYIKFKRHNYTHTHNYVIMPFKFDIFIGGESLESGIYCL